MKSLVVLAMLLLQSPPTTSPSAPASIEGIVLDSQMNPVAGAEVSAFWDPPPMIYQPNQVPRGYSDNAGKFVISNLSPGGYQLWITAAGYVPQTYGAKTAGGMLSSTGKVVSLVSGQKAGGITVRLIAASTISGRVVSISGDPLSGMSVNAVQSGYDSSGMRIFVPVSGGTETDDRGEYRISGIPPGRYYLRAASPDSKLPNELRRQIGRPPVSSGAYAAMYYPGVADVSGASFVEAREREDIRAINFVLPRLQTFRIRGHVLDATGKPLIQAMSHAENENAPIRPMIGLMPIEADFFTGSSASVTPYCGTGPLCQNVDGAFDMTDVAPGYYWISAQISQPLTPEQRKLLETPGADPSLLPQPQRAVAAVRVTNSDVDGVELRFYSKLSMTGQVLIDDSNLTAQTGLDSIRIGLRQSIAGVMGPVQNAVLDGQGRFSTGSLLPGDYRLDVRDLPPEVFIIDARLGDRDVSTELIRITAPPTEELNIHLSAKSGNVQGVVLGSNSKPVANATIVLIPINESNRPDRYKKAASSPDGRFQIQGIAPGEYSAYSWEAIDENAWFDPGVLRQFESKGTSIHVLASSNDELQLTLIPSTTN